MSLETAVPAGTSTVLSGEPVIRNPQSDVGADEGVGRHDIELVELRLLCIQRSEHPREVVAYAPGHGELLAGRKHTLLPTSAISEPSTGRGAEEERLPSAATNVPVLIAEIGCEAGGRPG